MEYKLEHKIRLNSEPKHKALYGWCLNEIDEDGKQIDRDLVPWYWSLYFTASSLRLVRETCIEIKSKDESTFSSESSQSTRIIGTLHSGYPMYGDELWYKVSFSFMGTDRKFSRFNLTISPNKSGEQDLCEVVAIPSYETEIDSRNIIEDDYLGFEVSLNIKLFDDLVRAIESNSADAVTMRVRMVRGFYSDWSPSNNTAFIKVLTNDVKIEGIEDGKFVPPTTCIAKEFSITFSRVNSLNFGSDISLKLNEAEFVENKPYPLTDNDNDNDNDNDKARSNESNGEDNFRNSVVLAWKLISSLRFPLWAIFVVLVLLLFK
jgi:hypothetical protein